MNRIEQDSIALALAATRPDRGNRYASKTTRTRGGAAYSQWIGMIRGIALALMEAAPTTFQPIRFLERSGLEPDEQEQQTETIRRIVAASIGES